MLVSPQRKAHPRYRIPAAVFAALAAASLAAAQGSADAFVVKIPGQSMTSSVTLSLSDGTAGSGQTVEVPLNLTSNGTAVPATFQIDLSFDQQKLTFDSARVGAQLSGANKSLSFSVLPTGDVRLVTTGMNQTAIANGLIAYASFTLNAQFTAGGTAVALKNCIAGTAQGGGLSTSCSAGTIKLFSCDINGDAVVNVLDVQLLINEAMGLIPASHDLNHDGAVNVADVQKLINAAMGRGCPY